ncbi:MAG: glutamate--tRNA ligase [Patescibacteria group bacterium]
MIRTRFAPSPTGYLHVGGLRTALYSYLVAKQNKGKFLLRIEDTDRERFVADGVKNILDSLGWAGIVHDEKLYTQSEHLDVYKKYTDQLIDAGQAYYCFCTPERLEKLREDQQIKKMPTKYDKHCLSIDPQEAKKRVAAGEKHVIRLKMPETGETAFTDLIRGEVVFKNELVDDQVLLKSDGFPTYHLAVVVDDHLMNITHIIRGEEWISSVPKHIQLYKYFGWEVPNMAHLPLLLNPDKSKLSKRQGDVAVEDYRKKGYLPEALINFVAFLGWNPGTEKEIFSIKELIKEFKLEKVNKSGAVFNLEKLDWYNKQYIKKLSNKELAKMAGLNPKDKKLENAIALERERITVLSELPEAIKFITQLPEYEPDLLIWKKSSKEEAAKILPQLAEFLAKQKKWTKESLEAKVGEWMKEKAYSTGSVLWPLRVALSGQQNSPGPYEIAEVLGKEETLNRIQTAIRGII